MVKLQPTHLSLYSASCSVEICTFGNRCSDKNHVRCCLGHRIYLHLKRVSHRTFVWDNLLGCFLFTWTKQFISFGVQLAKWNISKKCQHPICDEITEIAGRMQHRWKMVLDQLLPHWMGTSLAYLPQKEIFSENALENFWPRRQTFTAKYHRTCRLCLL